MDAFKYKWADLLIKYLLRVISPEERRELERQKASSALKQAQFEACTDRALFAEMLNNQVPFDPAAAWEELAASLQLLPRRIPWYLRRNVLWPAAAIFIIGLSVWGYHYYSNRGSRPIAKQRPAPVRPGNGVFLIFPNGNSVDVSKASQGIFGEGSDSNSDSDWEFLGGKRGVRFKGSETSKYAAKNTYYLLQNRDKLPFELLLPDNTQIILNVGSSIQLPTLFSKTQRSVVASGEVYFKVARDPYHPFYVTTAMRALLEVLGTEFNVCSPKNDTEKISLLEGFVKLKKNGQNFALCPGQDALVSSDNRVQVVDAPRAAEAITWTFFEFTNKDIRSIITELGQRYQVNIHFTGQFSDRTSSGRFSMTQPLKEILGDLAVRNHIDANVRDDEVYIKALN